MSEERVASTHKDETRAKVLLGYAVSMITIAICKVVIYFSGNDAAVQGKLDALLFLVLGLSFIHQGIFCISEKQTGKMAVYWVGAIAWILLAVRTYVGS